MMLYQLPIQPVFHKEVSLDLFCSTYTSITCVTYRIYYRSEQQGTSQFLYSPSSSLLRYHQLHSIHPIRDAIISPVSGMQFELLFGIHIKKTKAYSQSYQFSKENLQYGFCHFSVWQFCMMIICPDDSKFRQEREPNIFVSFLKSH